MQDTQESELALEDLLVVLTGLAVLAPRERESEEPADPDEAEDEEADGPPYEADEDGESPAHEGHRRMMTVDAYTRGTHVRALRKNMRIRENESEHMRSQQLLYVLFMKEKSLLKKPFFGPTPPSIYIACIQAGFKLRKFKHSETK